MYISHPLIKTNKIEARDYQESILRSAINKNTLVVVPTALGKTVIAVLLSAHFLEIYPKKKILIMAPTRPLAAQHASSFIEFLKIEESGVALLTGITPPSKREEIWRKSRIICATPQVIRNDLVSGRISKGDLSLAVFDEAHHAVGDYPYPAVASQLECRILALTASPGSDISEIQGVLKNLKIENVELRDETDPDTAPYVKGFEVEWKKVKLPEPYWVVRNLLIGLLRKRLKTLKTYGIVKSAKTDINRKELLSLMSELKKSLTNRNRRDLYHSISLVSGCLTISHALELIETQGVGQLSSYLKRTAAKADVPGSSKAIKELSRDHDFKRVLAMSETLKERYEDPKLEALREIISLTKRDTRVIVFTQYRGTGKAVVKALNELEGVRAVRFVGQASKKEDLGLSQKEQLEILHGFKEGPFNILVATSVAEEGLDIPSVDLVVFFEPVPSEIRVIQRRGRTGRTSIGRVIVLMAEKTRDEGIYWSSVAKERRMKKSLKEFRGETQKPDKKKISDWIDKS
jgi:Fanconi anemia group M protein